MTDLKIENRKKKENEGAAAYIGIAAPETPKYLLTNNFLADYFETTKGGVRYSFAGFVEDQMLYTEEDKINEKKLEVSFNRFLDRYLGEEIIREENTRLKKSEHFYFPLIPEMLTGSTATLRHVLYHIQRLGNNFNYTDIQKKLERYIFEDNSGLNYILMILLQGKKHETKYKKEEKEDYWKQMDTSVKRRMAVLGRKLNEDLDTLLTKPYFLNLDFYRRYHYLSVLLTSYVIQYILARKESQAVILCKGNPMDSQLGGTLHRACCNNYEDIRNLFPSLLKDYYEKTIRRLIRSNEDQENLSISGKDGKVTINGEDFQEFADDMIGRKTSSSIPYEKLMDAFKLQEGESKKFSVNDFVLRYVNLTKTRRGSTVTKLSSTLSTSGKQIEMVYPRSNAKQKYFAMSENLAEFYVRLYLARKDQKYDYLDNFLRDLQKRYQIIITKSAEGDRKMRTIKPKVSAQDYAKNKLAFIETLNNVSCLIKLSDSGYVITLPEMKGDFRLI